MSQYSYDWQKKLYGGFRIWGFSLIMHIFMSFRLFHRDCFVGGLNLENPPLNTPMIVFFFLTVLDDYSYSTDLF